MPRRYPYHNAFNIPAPRLIEYSEEGVEPLEILLWEDDG